MAWLCVRGVQLASAARPRGVARWMDADARPRPCSDALACFGCGSVAQPLADDGGRPPVAEQQRRDEDRSWNGAERRASMLGERHPLHGRQAGAAAEGVDWAARPGLADVDGMHSAGWLYLKDQGLLGAWAARWVAVRPGVMSIHAAGPMSAVLSNVALLRAQVEPADFSSVMFRNANQFGIAILIDPGASKAASGLLPLHLHCASLSLALQDEPSRDTWMHALRACSLETGAHVAHPPSHHLQVHSQRPDAPSHGAVARQDLMVSVRAHGEEGESEREREQARERERERELQTLDCEEVDAWLLQTLKDISMRWRPASFDPAGLNLEPSTLNSEPYPTRSCVAASCAASVRMCARSRIFTYLNARSNSR